jgi:hypothetical protein
MVRRIWWRTSPNVSIAVITAAMATSAFALVIVVPVVINVVIMAIAAVTFAELFLAVALSPYMGKKEFLRRFGGIPRFCYVYLRNSPLWIRIIYAALCLDGVVEALIAAVVAPRGSGLVRGANYFAVVSPSGHVERVTVGIYEFTWAAIYVLGPMSAILIFHALLLLYLSADRFLGGRPQLWPSARDDQRRTWLDGFRSFPRAALSPSSRPEAHLDARDDDSGRRPTDSE